MKIRSQYHSRRKRSSKRQQKTRKSVRLSPLRSVYGEMIVKKDTYLYHTSPEPFEYNPSKPMLFLTFHPSEWSKPETNRYVTKFKVRRDLSLFFMVSSISTARVVHLLDILIGTPGKNLAKMNTDKLRCFIPYLQESGFDGWFSTIENSPPVEVALINDPSLVELVDTTPLNTNNWTNCHYNESDYNHLIPKDWGSLYEISLRDKPVILNINRRYESMIDQYLKDIDSYDPEGNIIHILLKNAKIKYIDAPLQSIKWTC